MKKLLTTLTVLTLAAAGLFVGGCSSMPESHHSDMQTHEMGPRGKSQSMGNSVMPERANQ